MATDRALCITGYTWESSKYYLSSDFMGVTSRTQNLDKLEVLIERILREARIPGAALAVVDKKRTLYARGFGYRNLKTKDPVTNDTAYPIASTTKAMNATLLGMLVDEGLLEWDAPVQRYLPQFRLQDAVVSSRVTVRDLVTMRTGLPRHDWIWMGRRISRTDLVASLAHLDASADFRCRFQYSNLSVTVSGRIAEVVTNCRWESLVRERIFRPLGMLRTSCTRPAHRNVTLSYHENSRRRLVLSRQSSSDATAPSGGAIYSTIGDMARWATFNLNGGHAKRRRLIHEKTLAEIHKPQVIIGDRSLTGFPPDAAYALGWAVHSYNGHRCLWHGGYLNNVNSSVMFFPDVGVGFVSFTNFGCSFLADLINQHAFDVVLGSSPVQPLAKKLAQYERKISKTRKRNASVVSEMYTRPSHPLKAYPGRYEHAGYGEIIVRRHGRNLTLQRNALRLPLMHWHYDVWIAEGSDMWPIHEPHGFDRASPIQFHADCSGRITEVAISLEPEVKPIRFVKRQSK